MKTTTKTQAIHSADRPLGATRLNLDLVTAGAVVPGRRVEPIELYRQDERLKLEFSVDAISQQVRVMVCDAITGQVLRVASARQLSEQANHDPARTGGAARGLQ